MNDASPSNRPRPWRLQFSLRLLLLGFTAFAIGFPVWYRWPYTETTEERDPVTGAVIATRTSRLQRQYGGGRVLQGKQQQTYGKSVMTTYYVNGQRHGPFAMQDPIGRIKTSGQYADDMREGRWTFAQGDSQTTAHYQRDKLHGLLEVEASTRIRRPRVVAEFDSGRLIKYNGQPAKDHLADILQTNMVDERTAMELQRDSQFDVVEMPLKDCVMYLADMHVMPFVIDSLRLKSGELQADLPITDQYAGIDLCSLLTLITAPRGLACDYRYGCVWITTADDVDTWRDPTGVTDLKLPAGSALERAWNEIAPPVDVNQTPLAKIIAAIEQPLALKIDTSQIQPTSENPNRLLVTNFLRDLPFRHVLGQLLYQTGCRCQLEGDKLVILPPEENKTDP